MSSVVVCGGGVVGLCTAMMLARDGVAVTLLEADPAEPPGPVDAWTSWTRKGVAQFRQPHNLFGRFREICDDELPGLTDKLLAAGCVWVDFLESLPPGIADRAPRPGSVGASRAPPVARDRRGTGWGGRPSSRLASTSTR